MAIWRSANDIIMSAGQNGSIPPIHIVQLVGILPNDQCRYNRVGYVWLNPLCLRDNYHKYMSSGLSIQDMYESRNDASSLKDSFYSLG
eukprot:6105209-Pyramimonas_sp.AAC.1